MKFALHSAIDVNALARRFAVERRVRIQPFLDDAVAIAIATAIEKRDDWRQVVNSGDKVFELDRATQAGLTAEQRAALDLAVFNSACDGFQYRYEAIRLPDGDGRAPAEGLAAFPRWMSSDPVRTLLRRVTGSDELEFADGQATSYGPGDLLTAHDDNVAGKNRVAAYVLGLTRQWRPEWGGLLLFHDTDGRLSGRVPAFNSLDLFAVPQLHSVSLVTPGAPVRRRSITGWLRMGRDGG